MIVAMIMNGCIVSLVYPVSVFIYALLEEKRPNKKYWQFIVMYTSTVLVIKFVLQTYPLSDWLTRDVDESGREQEHNSVNDYLRTIRLGLEVVVDGRNFVSFFLFEALILLTVTLHIFIQVFGGVWDDREIEKETIHQAAARIANVQKQRRLEKSGKIKNKEEEESLDDLLAQKYDAGVRPPDYHRLIRRRAYSVNDCLRMTEIADEIENRSIGGTSVDETVYDDWAEVEHNFAYGEKRYDDHADLDCVDYGLKEMRKMTRKEFMEQKDELKNAMVNAFSKVYWKKKQVDVEAARNLKTSQRSLTEYHYKLPDQMDLTNFVIENKAGENPFKRFFLKLKVALTQGDYFESLFPSIKEQKPGLDLYAPMAAIQLIIIVFMIFFYTRMDPDYTNVTSGTLTPTSFNQVMIIAVFIQIAIIVLDRYLYLARDYVVIDEVDLEHEVSDEDSEEVEQSESLSQFDRTKTLDLRSSSGEKLMVKGFGLNKAKPKLKNKSLIKKDLEDYSDDENEESGEYDDNEVLLSKTNFNKTIIIKYYLQLFLLILIHVITFWYFPIKANVDLQVTPYCDFSDPNTGMACNEVFMNWTLVVFYLLYCAYFAISALQIRYGLPELRKGNFAMNDTGPINKGIFQGYLAAPFIVELKIISDWTFTRTALDLFQWIKFETIYGDLFIAKCQNKAYLEHPLGDPMPKWKKASFGC